MKPSIYKVTPLGLGQLFVMPKPSTDWLEDDIKYFKSLGIDKVVSLLEIHEEKKLGLEQEQAFCLKHNIKYVSFPIKDRGLPKAQELKPVVVSLLEELKSGKNISVHCRGGIGRTGILSCCLLIEHGLSPSEAIALVSKSRNCAIPDTEQQVAFIQQYVTK
jgi:protein-tyrosine phosphatase